MISEKRVRELIALGTESRNLDYKGAFSWASASNEEKCELVKDILAFSNTRDGGVILIGVNDKSCTLEGISDEQSQSFDQTKVNDFLAKHSEPRHSCQVHRLKLDDKKVVAIEVPEFQDVPILSKHSVQSTSKPSQLILRQAGLYKRTDKASSELIEDADEMRELLNRALLKRQDELFRAFRHIVQPRDTIGLLNTEAEFEKESQEADAYFATGNDVDLIKLPHWRVEMRPETYVKDRIAGTSEIQRRVADASISLRGWSFPIAGHVGGSPWSNFGRGSQSFYAGGISAPEAVRAYRSALFVWCSGFSEEYWSDLSGKEAFSFVNLIFSMTEWILFAQRFYEQFLSLEENLQFRVSVAGTKGRKLVSINPGVSLIHTFRADVDSFDVEIGSGMSDLRSDPEAVARGLIRRVFEMFNWNNPEETMLFNWQRKLIQKQFW